VARERAVRRHHFDVLHVVYQNRFTDLLSLRRLARLAPLVCTVHDAWPHDMRVPRPVVRPYLRALYRISGAIMVLNEQLKQILIDEFDVDPDRIHVVPHQIPQFRTEPKTLSREPTVLFFGTLRRNKGVDVLLRAVPKFADAGVRVIVAGRGDPTAEREVLELGQRYPLLETHVGWVSAAEKWQMFDRSDLVLLPYNDYASESGVLNDAYGHHTPVVVTDVRSLGANVRHLGTGWVVPAGDSGALVDASLRALNDRDAWNAAMTRCRDRAFANRPTSVADRMREVYKLAADGRWQTSRR
jgi:glycosyltransferase involved in cell wall biosynthesis